MEQYWGDNKKNDLDRKGIIYYNIIKERGKMAKTKLTPQQKVEKKLEGLDDDEKLRLLYRIEIYNMHDKLSGILRENGVNYSSFIPEFYHYFFDGNYSATIKYQKLQNLFGYRGAVCDYFDSFTLYAYAMFMNKFISEYDDFGYGFDDALKSAYDFINNLFDRDEYRFDLSGIITIDKDMRGYAESLLMKDLNISSPFLDEKDYYDRMDDIRDFRFKDAKSLYDENGYLVNDAGLPINAENGYTDEDIETTRE